MCAARCHAESGHAPLPLACCLDCKSSASFELGDSQARAAPAPCWPHPFAVKTSAQRRPEASLVESAHGESALRNQRHQCAQEPAASARQKTRRENCAAREGSAHSTNALRLKHATCPWVVFLCLAIDRSRRASSVSSGLCFATFPY